MGDRESASHALLGSDLRKARTVDYADYVENMNYETEFKSVDLLLNSSAETSGVDAFALSLIKTERQLRRIVTHLVYQYPCFSENDIPALVECLAKSRSVYFEGFERGFDAMYRTPLKSLIGDKYVRLRQRLIQTILYRNKIFHGQLTGDRLSRQDLISLVADIREWCSTLADACESEFSFNGLSGFISKILGA